MSETTKILIVDDVEANLTALAAVIAAPHLEILTARSGADALELLLVHEVALALLDVQMPEMNGYELAELMRGTDRTRDIPIIFLTAGGYDPVGVFRGYDSGAVDYLYKPLDAWLVRSKVGVFVQLYQQKKQLAAQLTKLQQMLEVSDRFISVLGHDLRGPSNAISLATELLLEDATEPQTKTTLQRIHRATGRMNRLVSQLLDFARARMGGGIPIRPVKADLAEIVRAGSQEVAPNGSQIEVAMSGQTDGVWDPDRLLQVVVNLLQNAVSHGDAGSPVKITLDGSTPTEMKIVVHNHGAVIQSVRANLFEPGPRKDGRTTGLGLGLYIVDQIVRGHGGTVACDSDAATGTTFSIKLPRETARAKS